MYESLFSKGKIGTLETKNRVVMTAMGNHLASEDGSVSKKTITFYKFRADGGVGLIITECASVDFERGKGNDRQLSVASDEQIPGLSKLAQAVHEEGAKIAVQIYHPGRQGVSAVNGGMPMMAPSAIECKMVHQPTQEMTITEVEDMVEKFISGAVRVKAAGFDAVEVHAAHGYLLNQFLSPYTNRRTDKYGGSFENRMRILDEIISGIRERCGKDFPLIVRISADEFLNTVGLPYDGIKLVDGAEIAKHLERLGVDALDVTVGIYETMNVSWEPSSYRQGWKIYVAEAIKKEVSIPVIGVSVIRDPAYANRIIAEGKVDFVGSARAHYADAYWTQKAQNGQDDEIKPCISCLYCMETLVSAPEGIVPVGCSVNIQSGNGREYGVIPEDGDGRTVAVIGAGPSGMEAARVLALRKFKVVVFEKANRVGGQLEYANKPPKKEKLTDLIRYLERQLKRMGVEIRLGQPATIDALRELSPYAVVIAQGSTPVLPRSIEGIGTKGVLTPAEVLGGEVRPEGMRVAVIGSGMTGIETAEFLAEMDNEVSLFEMGGEIGPGLFFQNLIDVMSRIERFGIRLYPGHKLIKIEGGGATFLETETDKTKHLAFDYIVLSLGTSPNKELVSEIQKSFDKVVVVGDAEKPGRIRNAMESGFISAYNL